MSQYCDAIPELPQSMCATGQGPAGRVRRIILHFIKQQTLMGS